MTTEAITIPAEKDLIQSMPSGDLRALLTWFSDNGVNPHAVTISRPIVISDTIDRWEVVDHTGSHMPAGLSRREHELADGQEWSNDGEFAKAIHHVVTDITQPMTDEMRARLAVAITEVAS